LPINQAARKVAAALAAGCADLPAGLLNLVFGVPADISSYLIPHRTIRKVSFTDSVPVAKRLAMLARAHMKRVTMELGGDAAAIVFADADLVAAKILSANKYRNAGQTLAIFGFAVATKVLIIVVVVPTTLIPE
jgi:succinate-semialdehyde dehydrogenase/glutarate-semialdehyde dehydrogenase